MAHGKMVKEDALRALASVGVEEGEIIRYLDIFRALNYNWREDDAGSSILGASLQCVYTTGGLSELPMRQPDPLDIMTQEGLHELVEPQSLEIKGRILAHLIRLSEDGRWKYKITDEEIKEIKDQIARKQRHLENQRKGRYSSYESDDDKLAAGGGAGVAAGSGPSASFVEASKASLPGGSFMSSLDTAASFDRRSSGSDSSDEYVAAAAPGVVGGNRRRLAVTFADAVPVPPIPEPAARAPSPENRGTVEGTPETQEASPY